MTFTHLKEQRDEKQLLSVRITFHFLHIYSSLTIAISMMFISDLKFIFSFISVDLGFAHIYLHFSSAKIYLQAKQGCGFICIHFIASTSPCSGPQPVESSRYCYVMPHLRNCNLLHPTFVLEVNYFLVIFNPEIEEFDPSVYIGFGSQHYYML